MDPSNHEVRVRTVSGDADLFKKKAAFIQHSLPGLDAGRYQIQVQQTLQESQAQGGGIISGEGLPSLTRKFGVSAPRYVLPQNAIQSAFPPPNSAGEFSNSLAHVVLEVEKLPWMRSPYIPAHVPAITPLSYQTVVNGVTETILYEGDVASWLGVLLVSPNDLNQQDPTRAIVQGKVLDLIPESLQGENGGGSPVSGTLPPNGYSIFSYLLETGQSGAVDPGVGQSVQDPVQYIDLPCSLFNALAPSLQDLKMMAHVRAVEMDAKPIPNGQTVDPQQSYALVMGNRLPESLPPVARALTTANALPPPAPGTNVALLVSLESMEYALRDHSIGDYYDTHVASQSDGFVRLVVLYSWRFTSRQDTAYAFETFLETLNGRTIGHAPVPDPQLRCPAPPPVAHPTTAQAVAQDMIASGYVPLNHVTRVTPPNAQGEKGAQVKTVSWYRGPLIPNGAFVPDITLLPGDAPIGAPTLVHTSDQLLRFDPNVGMYDVSYASAWQLGRLVSLQNTDFSTSLYRWKKQVAVQYRVLKERAALAGRYEPLWQVRPQASLHTAVTGRRLRENLLHHLATGEELSPAPKSYMAETPSAEAARTTLLTELAATPPPDPLIAWLAKLQTLQGIPFSYLIATERLLTPETIKFFQVDPVWMAALKDGALSIGRRFSAAQAPSPALIAEQAHRPQLHKAVRQAASNLRRQQLKRAPIHHDTAGVEVAHGFLLRSQVVSDFQSMDVIGYEKGHSPYDYEQGKIPADQVQAMDILRLERLSATVLIGLFSQPLYELVLHQPPEAIHFGFQTIDIQGDKVTKNLRTPTTSWDDPNTTYDTQTYQNELFSNVFVRGGERVIDLFALSQAMGSMLNGFQKAPGYYQPHPDSEHQDHLLASEFALEMVQGVGLVSFINDVPAGQA